MSMDVTFLGTGSAFPSPHRGASGLVVRTEGEHWLFDCGEGTQTQLMRSQLKTSKINKVFISHLHGDHVFGLPGLLCTISLHVSPRPDPPASCVDIYGPRGLRNFLRFALKLSSSQLSLSYAVHELETSDDQCPEDGRLSAALTLSDDALHPQERPGTTIQLDPDTECYNLIDDKRFVVKAFRLYHRVSSFGFSVEERDRPGRLNTDLLKELGLKPGPLYGRLKNGEPVTLESGQVLTAGEVLEPPLKGRKVCVFGDCSAPVGEGYKRACQGADVLVHEATLGDGQRDKAVERGHSTPSMAAAVALACGARTLVLYHFSQRYKPEALRRDQDDDDDDDDVTELKSQAESVLQGSGTRVILAQDFLILPIALKKNV